MNATERKPHFTQAPKDLQREYIAALDAVCATQKPDALGRLDWPAINRAMVQWWEAKGYVYP